MINLRELLEQMVQMNASDLHLTVGSPPVVRVDGKLQKLNMDMLSAEQTKKLAYSMLNEKQKLKFEQNWELDFSFGIENMSRFRCNIFMQRGNTAVALASDTRPLGALTLAEALDSSGLPGGAVNILTGLREELLPGIGSHMDVNAVLICSDDPAEQALVEREAAANLKRVVARPDAPLDDSPWHILDFQEIKTTWHPIGT